MTDIHERLARMESLALMLTQEIASLRAEITSGVPAQPSATSIGHAITVARTRMGIKRPALATLAGVSYPYLAEIETGRKNAPVHTLKRIAEALGMPVAELLA